MFADGVNNKWNRIKEGKGKARIQLGIGHPFAGDFPPRVGDARPELIGNRRFWDVPVSSENSDLLDAVLMMADWAWLVLRGPSQRVLVGI
ncbi:hypothetical protein CEXT_741071 [Caerostris extrusa]|uniref:Uncharacterized protein n=1 Tax=Caerostris extrusa TaxID=172846 RepID=A0AAV4Q9H0_CAEEX|nr:hypothetical protein CEXT_741071 [Caerostris extrusa]